jgi:quercetin dioxygenase-like cupin family protein
MNSKRIVVELERGALLPVHDGAGATVACLQGELWITEEQDGQDVVLRPGQSLRLERNGRTVVQALSAARVAVDAPPASGWPIALSPLRLLGSAP